MDNGDDDDFDNGDCPKIERHEVVRMISVAWDAVTPAAVRRSFEVSGIIENGQPAPLPRDVLNLYPEEVDDDGVAGIRIFDEEPPSDN